MIFAKPNYVLISFLIFISINANAQKNISNTDHLMGVFIDKRDNNEYKWIKIGSQTWMAENLAYLPSVNSPSESSNYKPLFYVYDYYGKEVDEAKKSEKFKRFGVLYNWEAAKISVPPGWHLPSDKEFKILESFIGIDSLEIDKKGNRGRLIGRQLKSITEWTDNYGVDEFGFSGLPAGQRDINGEFNLIRAATRYWTSSENGNDRAWTRILFYDWVSISRWDDFKEYGVSVRCIKDY